MRSWLTKLLARAGRLAERPWQRLLWNLGGAFMGGLLTALGVVLITAGSFGGFPALLDSHTKAALWSALFFGLLSLILGLAVKRLAWGYLAASLLGLVLTTVNYFKMRITAVPLELQELTLVTRLGAITELNASSIHITPPMIAALLMVLLWFAVLLVFAGPLSMSWRQSLSAAGGGLLAFLLVFVLLADPLIYSPARVTLDARAQQGLVYDQCFVPLGLWRSVIFRDNRQMVDVNDPDAMRELMDQLEWGEGSKPSGDVQPNIILILSESFMDVTSLPGVEFEEDPLAEYHALQEQSVSGRFFSRTLGYGTCNIELEVLTGINSQLLEYGEDLMNWEPEELSVFPTVPELFREEGYYTAFLHMFDDGVYNRTDLFSCLGFDDMYFSDNFAAIDPELRALGEDTGEYLAGKVSGDYYGDAYMTELLIDLYEREESNGPVFLYASSIENHTPYYASKYPSFEYPFTSELTGAAAGTLNSYVQGISNSSKALQELVDYFSRVDEPTVIVFYGDHAPGLGLDEGSVYTELGVFNGDTYSLEPAAAADLYAADYLIWANDPSLLPGEPGTVRDTSCGFLGLDLLNAGNIALPRFWRMVEDLRSVCKAYNRVYYVGQDGAAAWDIPRAVDHTPFTQMAAALADARNERYMTDWLCLLPGQ